MCILFCYVNHQAGPDEFKLICASNRDEYFSRPTEPAHYWNKHKMPAVIGGRDYAPGKVGGTWMAISQSGKIGAVLNILHHPDLSTSGFLGRGFLVNKFLLSPNTGITYLQTLAQEPSLYLPYTMVTIDVTKHNGPEISYFTNDTADNTPVCLGNNGIFSFGNSPFTTPFKKVSAGEQEFTSIVKQFRTVQTEKLLVDNLLKMLGCKTKYLPDELLFSQGDGLDEELLSELSSRCVYSASHDYGTRSSSVILVDGKYNAKFYDTEPAHVNKDSASATFEGIKAPLSFSLYSVPTKQALAQLGISDNNN